MLQLQVEMENTTSATTKKVKNYMPCDLAFLITSKLPPKSVKRFGCLCKSWDLNFENPHFMSIFRKNFISNHRSRYADTSLLLNISSRCSPRDVRYLLYSLLGEKFENKHKLDWPNPFPNDDNYFHILVSYSVNGTLCLYNAIREPVFWNPATKEFKVIPLSPYIPPPCEKPQIFCHGFGFDNVRNDYKLIRYVNTYPGYEQQTSFEPFWEIYSLRSNSWKKLDGDAPPSRMYNQVEHGAQLYTEGMCHLWGRGISKTEHCGILSSFDLGNEVFIATPITSYITSDMEDDGYLWFDLILLNGSIALISHCFRTPTFHIAVLGELGVKESWTKLFIIGPLPYIAVPIGAGKKGDLFFMKLGGEEHGEIVYFDLSTKKTHELGIKGYRSSTLVYKQSFIPMEGINN